MLCHWFMDVNDMVEPMHNYFLNSFSMNMASRLAIMASCWYFLNRLKLFSDQIVIHIQSLLGEDQVVMEIMTRMASWLCGIYFRYVLYEMMLISLHIHPCSESRVHKDLQIHGEYWIIYNWVSTHPEIDSSSSERWFSCHGLLFGWWRRSQWPR